MGSVEFDAGGPWSATRGAKTLHGDTAKLPRGTKKCHAGVFFVSPSRAINACVSICAFELTVLLLEMVEELACQGIRKGNMLQLIFSLFFC